MPELFVGPDGRPRCHWCGGAPEFLPYHDTEWGFPQPGDRPLFEKLCLEGFQSGLSWRTILAKRENFRRAFHEFDIDRVASFTPADIERLLQDSGIVRHRGKIQAVVHNARCAQEMVRTEGSLAAFFRRFVPQTRADAAHGASTSPESVALSRELKKRGWKFVGPTTVYAFMQAMGMVNDHASGCYVRALADAAQRGKAVRP